MNKDYVLGELYKLQPLSTQMDDSNFKIKITSPFGETHYMDITYKKYFAIAKVLLEDD